MSGNSKVFETYGNWVVYQNGVHICTFSAKEINMRIAIDYFRIYSKFRGGGSHF